MFAGDRRQKLRLNFSAPNKVCCHYYGPNMLHIFLGTKVWCFLVCVRCQRVCCVLVPFPYTLWYNEWKYHFSEMRGCKGMPRNEKGGERPIPRERK